MVGDDVLHAVEGAVVEHFGHRPARASVAFVGVDPIEVLRFEPVPGERAFVTLGMARHPMVAADAVVRTADGPRAELMLHIRDPQDRFSDVWRRLAVLAAAPAVEGVVYRDGMSVDLQTPLLTGSHCTGVVIEESPLQPASTAAGVVEVLRAVPATRLELAWGRARTTAALRERWAAQSADLLDLARDPIDLA